MMNTLLARFSVLTVTSVMMTSGMLLRVAWRKLIDVLEVLTAYEIRVIALRRHYVYSVFLKL